jgi:hypothetical protein
MLRYKLRTLLVMLAILPPLSAVGWAKYQAWKAEQERQRALRESSQQQEVVFQTQGWAQPQPPMPGAAEPPQQENGPLSSP